MHLTQRENQVVRRLLKAEKREAIAADLGISVRTVDFHIENVKRKLKAQSVIQLVVFFARTPVESHSCDSQQLFTF